MLLIITEGLDDEFEKVKSKRSPKEFSKEHIQYGRKRYDNSTAFFRTYYGDRVDELTGAIRRYKQIKGKHQKDELYLADLRGRAKSTDTAVFNNSMPPNVVYPNRSPFSYLDTYFDTRTY